MSKNEAYYVIQDNLGEYSVLKGENMELICSEIEHKEIGELFCYELNDLAEENEQLKKSQASTLREFAKGIKKIQKLAGKNLKLKEENEQLKQENEQLKKYQITLELRIIKLKDRVENIRRKL